MTMTGLAADIRYAMRLLRKSPTFTSIAVATLALGIGANTVIFTGVESFLLRPLPLKDPERLVFLQSVNRKDGTLSQVSYPDYVDWKDSVAGFDHLAALHIDIFNVTGRGDPQRVRGSRVNAEFFPVLSLAPRLGRVISVNDDRPGAAPVVVLGYGYWMREFGGAGDAVGKTVVIDGRPHEVIGVMPAATRFPMGFDEFWVPLGASPAQSRRGQSYLAVVGRMAAGTTMAEVGARLDAIARRAEQAYPETNKDLGTRIVPLHEQLNRGPKRALALLFTAVTFVLMICCANLANLMLARGMHRSREIAIRVAVGAGRLHVFRQLLSESLILAAAGGTAGVLLASWGVEWLRRVLPPFLQPMGGLSINGRVLVYSAAVSILTGVLFGLAPALRMMKAGTAEELRAGGSQAVQKLIRSRMANALVVAEIALAALLLAGSGMLLDALRHMQGTDLGYDPRAVLTAELSARSEKYRDPARQLLLVEELLRRLHATPGVAAASAVNWPPMTNDTVRTYRINRQATGDARAPSAGYRVATPRYAEVMGIRVLKGRFVSDTDKASTEPVVIVNDLLAKRAWPGEDPLGKRLALMDGAGAGTWRTVAGVVASVRHAGPAADFAPELYVPFAQQSQGMVYLALKASGDVSALGRTLEAVVKEVDPDLPVALIRPMDAVIAAGMAPARFTANLVTLFSGVALTLAALGLYGLMSYLVARRVHEFGVRLALGATNGDLLRLVLRKALFLTSLGTLFGVSAGAAVSRVLAMAFAGVTANPLVFLAVAITLGCTAVAAAWIPLRRAMALGPLNALRES